MKGMQLILLLVIVVLLVCFMMGRGGIQLIRERGPNPVAAVGNHSSRVSDTAAPPARAEKTEGRPRCDAAGVPRCRLTYFSGTNRIRRSDMISQHGNNS